VRTKLLILLVIFWSCNQKRNRPAEFQAASPEEVAEYEREQDKFTSPYNVIRAQRKTVNVNLDSIDRAIIDAQTEGFQTFTDSMKRGHHTAYEFVRTDSNYVLQYASQRIKDSLYDHITWGAEIRGDTIYRLQEVVFSNFYNANIVWAQAYFLKDTTILLGTQAHQKTLLGKKRFLQDTLLAKFKKRIKQ